jgi:tetratricopeptide (TPR) repeat protein
VVATRGEVETSHVDEAEDLYARYPDVPRVRQALAGLLEAAARQAERSGQPLEAVRCRERAIELWPEEPRLWLALIQGHEERLAWRDAELAARRGLSACPGAAFLHTALATALMRQGRDEEAADVLRRLLAVQDDAAARGLLARLEKELGTGAGLAQQTSAHFVVRFEGQRDDALGRALLQMLEEKHAMLAGTLGFAPDGPIPVALYPRQAYQEVSAAPHWAGGYYSHSDGRIRIGTRDLSAGFVPLDLERTLTHELTHAFLDWRTRGVLPDDLNEGLAQYLSGRRLGYRLDPARTLVRDGRMKVDDFYDAALSFVEYLLDRYREPAMNDLLRYMGETGSVDRAFRRAYHQTYDETRQEWIRQLQ